MRKWEGPYCGTCPFFGPHKDDEEKKQVQGFCLRNPPTTLYLGEGNVMTAFPVVYEQTMACGCHPAMPIEM